MSEEKQLTVAELLARRAAERGSSGDDTPRRPRRRRSIEEGGISVAELTGSIPRVDRKPVESRHSSVPIDADDATQQEKVPAQKLVQEAEAAAPKKPSPTPESEASAAQEPAAPQPPRPAAPAAPQPEKPVDTPSATKPSPKAEKKAPSPSVEDTAQLRPIKEAEGQDAEATATLPKVSSAPEKPQVKLAQQTPAAVALPKVEEPALPVASEDDYDLDDDADAASGSIFSVILLAIVGIVLGVVIFIGFDLLWDHFNRKIVAALAVAVTAAMIGVIHAMRTARDGLSMLLAGLVGLLMTFGPLIIKLV